MPRIKYTYRFVFPNGKVKNFTLELDSNTLDLMPHAMDYPEWANLDQCQCTVCPLSPSQTPLCPIAANISELVLSFRETASYEQCTVSCITAERTIYKETIVQEGLSSIMGIIMATSGCPIMDILKPMARFHLPFATVDESMFRSVSVYLLRQYFVHLEKRKTDFYLENVQSYYKKIEEVNGGILQRIKFATVRDADNNAIVILNSLAQILFLELEDNLQSLQRFFTPLEDK